MILLDSPSWTDQLSAISSAIGIPGAIAAFILLFKKDKDKEKQIESLSKISEALQLQTTSLSEQTNILQKQLEYYIALQTESNKIAGKIESLSFNENRIRVMPNLVIKNIIKQTDHVIMYTLKNKGGIIKNLTGILDSEFVLLSNTLRSTINQDQDFSIMLHIIEPPVDPDKELGTLKLVFEDIYGNRYEQILKPSINTTKFSEVQYIIT